MEQLAGAALRADANLATLFFIFTIGSLLGGKTTNNLAQRSSLVV
jgi:hypothetical protein